MYSFIIAIIIISEEMPGKIGIVTDIQLTARFSYQSVLCLLGNMEQICILSTVVGVTAEYRASFLGIYLLEWLSGTTVTDEHLSCQATETCLDSSLN